MKIVIGSHYGPPVMYQANIDQKGNLRVGFKKLTPTQVSENQKDVDAIFSKEGQSSSSCEREGYIKTIFDGIKEYKIKGCKTDQAYRELQRSYYRLTRMGAR